MYCIVITPPCSARTLVSFPDAQFNVSMYKCYRNDYKCNEGGLMVYVRNDMIQRRRHDIEKCVFNNCDGRI